MSKIINLYGGPGTGKSTTAAYLFYQFKRQNENVELVREYVKEWAWEKRQISAFDQFYFFGKQSRKESLLYGKADIIVTDSPVMLSYMYTEIYGKEKDAEALLAVVKRFYQKAEEEGHQHFHVFLERTKRYNSKGRYETEEQARAIDLRMQNWLDVLLTDSWSSATTEPEIDAGILSKFWRHYEDGKRHGHQIR